MKTPLHTGFGCSSWGSGFTCQTILPWTTEGNCQLYLGERSITIITAALHTQAFIRFKIVRVRHRWFNVEFIPSFCFNRHSFLSKEAFKGIRFLQCISGTKGVTITFYVTIPWPSTAFPLCSREGFCPPSAHLWAPELWFNSPGQTPHLLLMLCPEWAVISNLALCCSYTPLVSSKCQGHRYPREKILRQCGWILSISLSFPLTASLSTAQAWQVWPGIAGSSSYSKNPHGKSLAKETAIWNTSFSVCGCTFP